MEYLVYQHRTVDGGVVYYGCTKDTRRPTCSKRRIAEHAELLRNGKIRVRILKTFLLRSAAEAYETKLIRRGRKLGYALFNRIADSKGVSVFRG